MSILTEGEISDAMVKAYILPVTGNDWEAQRKMNVARAIESAVLEKLAGMELPEPEERFVFAGLDWHRATPEYFKQMQGQANCIAAYSADQLHQAYAQGAASQLVQEPFGWITSESAYMLKKHGGNESRGTVPMHAKKSAISTIPLYTLKDPK